MKSGPWPWPLCGTCVIQAPVQCDSRSFVSKLVAFIGALFAVAAIFAQTRTPAPQTQPWRFAVSGDSRNCGDVVMPAIAAGVLRDRAEFYWHLGDFRLMLDFDEDVAQQPEHLAKPLTFPEYQEMAWQDFMDHQLAPFGSLPVFLVVGNHEMVPPKTRPELLSKFANWFNAPVIAHQRLVDNPDDQTVKTYYHWVQHGVGFYSLDNGSDEQFDDAQVLWFERVLALDVANPAITTIVAGMHRALPDSISAYHSMNESPAMTQSGRRVYADLLRVQKNSRKLVYAVASHSHYFMDGIFHTRALRATDSELPGLIAGTAGAQRYPLPSDARSANDARTNVYGYVLATVEPMGKIRFDFKRLAENDVPAAVAGRYPPGFVQWCWAKNTTAR
jgi:calcineurin-like phosphoesterase family protein